MTSSRDAVDHIDLLLTTDLLSEGVDLQDASVVVHLDVPWTPARLAQRVGRVARLGSAHSRVSVHGLAPPADVAAWLRIADRLRAKARAARGAGSPNALGAARRIERWWRDEGPPDEGSPDGERGWIVAAVRAPRAGLLALWRDAAGATLVASLGRKPATEDPDVVARAARLAEGEAAPVPAAALRAARRRGGGRGPNAGGP